MSDEYLDLDMGGTVFRLKREYLEHMVEGQQFLDAHFAAVGQLTWSYAGLDRNIDRLFEPLLQCSPEQVACMMVENISTRCTQLIHLLHLEAKPTQFRAWTEALLNRVSNELSGERNRYLHDHWEMKWSGSEKSVTRTTKRPSLAAPQSRQPKKLTFNKRMPVTVEQLENLSGRMETVSQSLWVARRALATWRRTKRLLPLHPQWIPASKPKALAHWDEAWNAELPQPPPPSRYE